MIERMSKDTYTHIDTAFTEFINFAKYKHKDKKTFEIEIYSGEGFLDDILGEIKWHGAWWKYVFYPASGCLFDTKCLKEIIKYIDQLMEDRKK